MSSATSTDGSLLRPWQFFLLAGMLAATAGVIVATGQSPASIVLLSVTIIATGLAGLGAYYTVLPLLTVAPERVPQLYGGRTRAALEREKTLALRAIKDLEFDYAMGKVARGDFDEMSDRLRRRATRLIGQLDEQGSYLAAIERELASRLAKTPDATVEPAQANLSPMLDSALADVLCEGCATANDPDARFCKSCGMKLADRASKPV